MVRKGRGKATQAAGQAQQNHVGPQTATQPTAKATSPQKPLPEPVDNVTSKVAELHLNHVNEVVGSSPRKEPADQVKASNTVVPANVNNGPVTESVVKNESGHGKGATKGDSQKKTGKQVDGEQKKKNQQGSKDGVENKKKEKSGGDPDGGGKKKEQKQKTKEASVSENHSKASQPERGILKVRFVAGSTSDTQPPSPPIQRHYPFALATESNVNISFSRIKARSDCEGLFGIESVILEFLDSLAQYVNEFNPASGHYRDQLLKSLQPQLSYLTENGVRRFPLALGNVIRQFKKFLQQINANASPDHVRTQCKEWLDDFYKANYVQATQAIVEFTIEKVYGLAATSILTFGWSPVVERALFVLCERATDQWEVTVLDSEPKGKALNLAKSLALRGVQTTYGQLSAVGELARHAHIVLLGGSAVLSNGHVLAARGAGLVALAARARNIPVLVTVKGYQFVDKVRSLEKHGLCALDSESLELIPADLITALVTEIRILPPTSAPAVLKAKQLLAS